MLILFLKKNVKITLIIFSTVYLRKQALRMLEIMMKNTLSSSYALTLTGNMALSNRIGQGSFFQKKLMKV